MTMLERDTDLRLDRRAATHLHDEISEQASEDLAESLQQQSEFVYV